MAGEAAAEGQGQGAQADGPLTGVLRPSFKNISFVF
jgi:hypothetical protein